MQGLGCDFFYTRLHHLPFGRTLLCRAGFIDSRSRGILSYSYVALGEFPAWIVGWAVTAQYLVSASTVAVGWSGYFVSFLKDWGIVFPNALTSAPIAYSVEKGWEFTGALINVPAIFLIVCVGCSSQSELKQPLISPTRWS